MTIITTYTSREAERLIRSKKAEGEYHVTGSLDLRGCRNPDPSQWWTERGEATRRRCIAVCPKGGYALIQTDTDLFSAGCQRNLTRERALTHWSRSDARAKLFTAAIKGAVL